ncbi:MAG: hypothetical protein Q9213_004816 [Squamulea squamosa]
MADSTPKSYHTDPTLYLYTSLTAGSSHIITATSRLETILKANRIPYQALDVATDEKARMLWGRRAGKRKLPGLVRMGMLVGDLEEIEEWNEYGELKDKVGVKPMPATPSAANTPTKAPPSTSTTNTPSKLLSSIETPPRHNPSSNADSPMATAMRQAGAEAAKKVGDAKAKAVAKAKGLSSTTPGTLPNSESSPISTNAGVNLKNSTAKGLVTKTTKPASEAYAATATADGADDTPESETFEGMGSADPDEEAVVPNSKGTINTKDNMEAASASSDLDADAVGSGSKDTIGAEDSKTSGIGRSKADDPDAEAVVPGTKNTGGTNNKVQAIHDDQDESSEDDKGDSESKAAGSNVVANATKATATADNATDLPGKRTQEQAPAKAEEAGTSVGD